MIYKWSNILILIVAIGISFYSGHKFSKSPVGSNQNNCDAEMYQFINPEFRCSKANAINKRNYATFKIDLVDYIKSKNNSGEVNQVSVYFRDMKNGPTLGIDEYKDYSPASLLKVPLLLTYYKFEETHPGTLDIIVGFDVQKTSQDDLSQLIPTKDPIKPNTPYKISELLDHMIKYSDNQAYYVLVNYLNQIAPNEDLLKQTYLDLGIVAPEDVLQQTISVKVYASIFTQLYNSSFFQKQISSENSLTLLTQTDFNDGIQAGVPDNIKVAHKFGEREGFSNGVRQLHDCGIVYYPKNPYLLCIMTQGKDLNNLKHVIKEISQKFYEEFSSRAN